MHDEAERAADTDRPRILALYEQLVRLDPGPVAELDHTVAVAMVHGPSAGLDAPAALDDDRRSAVHHRLAAVRAHLLDTAGDAQAAGDAYRLAARRTPSLLERRYLRARPRGRAGSGGGRCFGPARSGCATSVGQLGCSVSIRHPGE